MLRKNDINHPSFDLFDVKIFISMSIDKSIYSPY